MKRIRNLVEMWRQRGSNNPKSIVFGDVGSDISNCCNCSRNKKSMTKRNLFYILFVVFTVGVATGEYIMKRSIVDDCRILRATRFGEVYISCGTAQKL